MSEKANELLKAIAIRMMVGVTGKDAHGCEWYEGIALDAADELELFLAGRLAA